MWDISLRLKYKNIPQVYRCFSVYKYNSVYHIYNKYVYIYFFFMRVYFSVHTYTYLSIQDILTWHRKKHKFPHPNRGCHNHHQGPSSSIAGSIAGLAQRAVCFTREKPTNPSNLPEGWEWPLRGGFISNRSREFNPGSDGITPSFDFISWGPSWLFLISHVMSLKNTIP